MSSFLNKFPVIDKIFRNAIVRSYAKKSSTRAAKPSKSSCPHSSSQSQSQTLKVPQFYLDKCDEIKLHRGKSKLKTYRLRAFAMTVTCICYAFHVFSEHEEVERKFVPYTYMYIRTKKFFFGDHVKSFFHGPNNFIPEEETYEPPGPNFVDEDLKRRKALRKKHAQEENERRSRRKEEEEQS